MSGPHTTLTRLVLTTGGTGGHVFPALAVAQAVSRRHPDCKMLFIGGRGPERAMAEKAGLKFAGLPVRGVLGRGFKGVLALMGLGWSTLRALGILARFRPQAVIGFGGFAGFCPVLAAWLRRTPTLIHDQNSVPGAANRALGRLVRRVLVSFEGSKTWFAPGKVRVVGNPVRSEISARERREAPLRHLLVLGGSQGAKALNDVVIAALPRLRELGIEVLHQAGAADEARVIAAYAQAGADPEQVRGFMDDMNAAYDWADVALCRSGASTVFELAAAGLGAILCPFPFATHDHQTTNAKHLAEAGAGVLVPQGELTAERLLAELEAVTPERVASMSRAALGAARPDAAEDIVNEIETLAGLRTGPEQRGAEQ